MDEEEQLENFYATFGFSHSLGKCYVKLRAVSRAAAHKAMSDQYGNMWAFLYGEDELKSAIQRYNLIEVPFGTRNERISDD